MNAMLAVSADVVQAADLVLQAAGVLCIVGWTVRLFRGGAWRNPLAGVADTGGGPDILHVAATIFLFVALAWWLLSLVRTLGGVDLQTPPPAGAHGWHLFQSADGLARLLAAAFMAAILWRFRSFPPDAPKTRPLRAVWLGFLGMLIVVPLCTVQLKMGTVLWEWAHPNAAKPVHIVLQAVEKSAWGAWGVAQLWFSAVVVAPLAEELFFRGLLLQTIWRYAGRAWLSILLAAIPFGLVHVTQPQDVVPLATMGVVLGYVRMRYRSLAACVALHALFNARTMTAALLAPELVRG